MADLSITVKCGECGKELEDAITSDRWGNIILEATPCPDCLSGEYDKGFEKGSEEQ